MAEILLKATSPENPTPEQEPFVYKVGMPVVVMPDGHPWGNAERLPLFCRINLPGALEGFYKLTIILTLSQGGYVEEFDAKRRVWVGNM